MTEAGPNLMILVGRALLGLYFLVPGLMKFAAWDQHIALMERAGVPAAAPLLAFAGVAAIVGALLLFSGRFVRLVALGFVVYVLLVNVVLHNFWAYEGLQAQHEMQNFIKNLGILAGLLVLAGASAMRWPSLGGLALSDTKARERV